MFSGKTRDRMRFGVAGSLVLAGFVSVTGCISVVDFSTRKGVRGDEVRATTLVTEESGRSGSPTAAVRTGSWGFISGCVAPTHGPGIAFADEAAAAFEQMERELKRADLALGDVVAVTVYLTDIGVQHDEISRVFNETFSNSPPVLSCVEVTRLIGDARIQIDIVARDRDWSYDEIDDDDDEWDHD